MNHHSSRNEENEASVKDNIPKKIFLRDILEWAALLAVILSVMGAVYLYTLLSNFKVNIADYADLDDFIVASLNVLFNIFSTEFFTYFFENFGLNITVVSAVIILFADEISSFRKKFSEEYPKKKSIELPNQEQNTSKPQTAIKNIKDTVRWLRQKRNLLILFCVFIEAISFSTWISKTHIENIKGPSISSDRCVLDLALKSPQEVSFTSNMREKYFLISALNNVYVIRKISVIKNKESTLIIPTQNLLYLSKNCANQTSNTTKD